MEEQSLARLIGGRFIERRDLKAWQQPDGSYRPDRTPLTPADVEAHLSGKRTLGYYVVSADNTARVLAFDIDIAKTVTWAEGTVDARAEFAKPDSLYRSLLTKQLNATARVLAKRLHAVADIPIAVAFSGSKGVHVYGFTGSMPAADCRGLAVDILEGFAGERVAFEPLRGKNFFKPNNPKLAIEIEVFPKQDEVADGSLGNLLRLPLGINRKSGNAGHFLRFDGHDVEFAEMDARSALMGELPW